MPKITLDEFCSHWVSRTSTRVMASRLEFNVFDFATAAGDYTRQQFLSSFASGGFNGSKWAPRTSKWGKRFTHPLMNDTGTLARSIQSEAGRTDIVGRRSDRTRIFRKGARYCMWTTEKSFPVKGKRGRSKERYGHYAAIHNTDPKFGLYTVNQYSTRRPVHRQFIGFSPKTDDYIAGEIYRAVKRAVLTLRENPDDPLSPPLFKTVAIDNGQFARIVRDDNTEYETVFPAVFIHFINVRYLVQQQRIGEGRATMRVRFILNTLNNADEDKECEAFLVFQRLNVAIQDAKNHEPALSERCNLTYFDMPLSTNMLQAYWIDYEVWFRESSAWKYRDWVKRYVVMPPFTQHSDAPQHDSGGHGFHPRPEHDEVSGFSDTGSKN